MSAAVAAVVLVPLWFALAVALVGARAGRPAGSRGGPARIVAATGMAATLSAAIVLAWRIASNGAAELHVGGWAPPLGIVLRADGLAAALVLAIATVAAAIGFVAIVRAGATGRIATRFFTLWLFVWAGTNALVLSNDIFNLYVTLELVTLGAVALIAIGGETGALHVALRYMLIAIPGSLVYLVGVALLYGSYATLDIGLLAERMTSTPVTWAALSLLVAGLVLKAALFPVHAWLPPVYANARTLVAGLLAAIVGKTAFLVVLRVWPAVPPDVATDMGAALGVLASGAIVWGSLLAMRQARLRLVIAYSSVAHIGYMFMWFALATPGAWQGAAYVALSHAIAVAALFLVIDTLERIGGDDHIDQVQGLSQRLPLTFFALALAATSIMGMPPTGGFIGKWLLVRAAAETEQWWAVVVLVAGSLLSAAYMFRILRRAFMTALPFERQHAPLAGQSAAFLLATIGFVLGIGPGLVLELLAKGYAG